MAGLENTPPKSLFVRLQRFGLVGGLGFIVDAGLVTALTARGVDAFSARLVSILLAMLVTWRLNRALTFGASSGRQVHEGARYVLVAVVAALVNYACYSVIILMSASILPAIAVMASTLISMSVSYLGFSRFAFRPVV